VAGIFTISLDFELHWGGFEKWPLAGGGLRVSGKSFSGKAEPGTRNPEPGTFDQYFLNTRQVIPQMLTLFERYGVHVTWASVGLLMHTDFESLQKNFPALRPTYQHPELSAYSYIEQTGIGADETHDPFHYADTLMRQILNTEHQELGSHTFSHFYCNEAGQTVEQFRADLQAAQRAASVYGVPLKSLVFPRNQFNDEYLRVCYEEGFTSVRSNPRDWFWNIDTRQESGWKRLNRGLDAYFSIGNKNTYPLESIAVRAGLPLCLPASRLLRPYRPKELFLNRFKVERIKDEMLRAARANEVYHLWWHPHNFGWYPKESLAALADILNTYKRCTERWGMSSLSMGEVTHAVNALHGKSKTA
jgi:peptidoglycan/xylan/chitin deacetylase (PgdA/CDA1 family)